MHGIGRQFRIPPFVKLDEFGQQVSAKPVSGTSRRVDLQPHAHRRLSSGPGLGVGSTPACRRTVTRAEAVGRMAPSGGGTPGSLAAPHPALSRRSNSAPAGSWANSSYAKISTYSKDPKVPLIRLCGSIVKKKPFLHILASPHALVAA
jgi:hypothetical protein